MALVVQKFGGSSVANAECIRQVAKRVKATVDAGDQVVVVVSARQGVTDELIARAKVLTDNPYGPELDRLMAIGELETISLLSLALRRMGVSAVSRTAKELGIITDSFFSSAHIERIEGGDIYNLLANGNVVVVAGFQGIDEKRAITTLGRGGSDLTAISLAVALDAEACHIFTDVDGIYTADPRLISDSRKLEVISHAELLELAHMGARIMQAQAVELAEKSGLPFEVRSTFKEEKGTQVTRALPKMDGPLIRSLVLTPEQVKFVVSNVSLSLMSKIFDQLASENIHCDMIQQSAQDRGGRKLTFLISLEDICTVQKILTQLQSDTPQISICSPDSVSKVSIVGVGLSAHPRTYADLYRVLSRENILPEYLVASDHRISLALCPNQAEYALQILHDHFAFPDSNTEKLCVTSVPAVNLTQ